MKFYDFFMFLKRIKEKQEDNSIAELRKIQLLTQVIHTSKPQELVEEIESAMTAGPSKEVVGDLEGLERLKEKRGEY